MTVQLEYINHLLQFLKIFPVMLVLCLMLSTTTYDAQNYAGIIGWSLIGTTDQTICGSMLISFAMRKNWAYPPIISGSNDRQVGRQTKYRWILKI